MAQKESRLFDYCIALPVACVALAAITPSMIADDPATAARFLRRAVEPALRLGAQVAVGAVAIGLIPPLVTLEAAIGATELVMAIVYDEVDERTA